MSAARAAVTTRPSSPRWNALLRGILSDLYICVRRLANRIQRSTAAVHRSTARPSHPCALPTEVEPDDETVAQGQHHRLLSNTTTSNPPPVSITNSDGEKDHRHGLCAGYCCREAGR
jgi:hypothetical protein